MNPKTRTDEPVYGGVPNEQFLHFLGPIEGTVLDVGSGAGVWSPKLRRAGAKRLISVEPSAAADLADDNYDLVHRTTVEHLDLEPADAPDLIVVADCLEHLVDPWTALEKLRDLVRPQGHLAISTPNLRSIALLGRVLLKGRFDYSDAGGIYDRGHIRWFTQRSLEIDLVKCGWRPVRRSGSLGNRAAILNRITCGVAPDLLYHQLFVLAQAI